VNNEDEFWHRPPQLPIRHVVPSEYKFSATKQRKRQLATEAKKKDGKHFIFTKLSEVSCPFTYSVVSPVRKTNLTHTEHASGYVTLD